LSFLNVEGAGTVGAAQLMKEPPMAFGGWHLFTVETQPGAQSVKLLVDGRSHGTRDRGISAIHLEEFLLGARHYSNTGGPPFAQGFFDGDIAEFLLYNRALDSAQRGSVERYLQQKYEAWLPRSASASEQTSASAANDLASGANAPMAPARLEIR